MSAEEGGGGENQGQGWSERHESSSSNIAGNEKV